MISNRDDDARLLATAQASARGGRTDEAQLLIENALARAALGAEVLLGLGTLSKGMGRSELALRCFDRLCAVVPGAAVPHFNAGVVHAEHRRWGDALDRFDRALACDPRFAKAHSNRAAVLGALHRYDEALASSDRAIALAPELADAHRNRGAALKSLGRLEEAAASFEAALTLAPNFAEARYNLGLTQLALGRYREGWRHCEVRWQLRPKHEIRHAGIPQWHGQTPPSAHRILLWSEQGLGDTIQFCRYVPLVAQRAAQVILEVQPPLKALLEGLSPAVQVYACGESLPACDLQTPLMSLPAVFDTGIESIPGSSAHGYLAPARQRVDGWRSRLATGSGRRKVGFACSGSATHGLDALRSIPLADMQGLASGVDAYLLQKELSAADERALAGSGLVALRDELGDLADTAAAIANLDLVVTVDTSIAHLAGAMGKPVWILLSSNCDWRWMKDRSDSPWYPSARLFRQRTPGVWSTVLDELAAELARFALRQDSPLPSAEP